MFSGSGWDGSLPTTTRCPGLPRRSPAPAESAISSLEIISDGLLTSNTSTGTLEALDGNMFSPMPSAWLVAPRPPPQKRWALKTRPSASAPYAWMDDIKPLPDCIRSGTASDSAPKMQPCMYHPVLVREPTDTGKSQLIIVPCGAETLIGSKQPSLTGTSGVRRQASG